MKPWNVLGRTRTPDGTELTLTHHTSQYVILANGQSLMSSRMHGSEEALALLGCRRARTVTRPRVLVGGLGMGFTLRAALDCLPLAARVLVAELVPAVVEWNHGPLGALAKHPLDDPRVHVEEGDVAATMRSSPDRFDAVLLDVDNGPVALTASSNAGSCTTVMVWPPCMRRSRPAEYWRSGRHETILSSSGGCVLWGSASSASVYAVA